MYGKLRKNVGFSLMIFAFFFLFEPTYALIDPLPDFIGYTILCISLANLADINNRVMDALKGFLKCIPLSFLRFISTPVIEKIFAQEERSVGLLMFVFIFAFVDIAILIPSYKALFEGLLSLGTFNDSEVVFYKKRERGRNRTEKLYSLTLASLILKNVICALPEFTSLQTNGQYEFIVVVRVLAIITVTPLSVSWLCSILSYFIKIKRERAFIDSLTKKYIDTSKATPERYVYRVIGTGLSMVLVSMILSYDLYSQNVNYIPDLFCFALLILAVLLIRRNSRACAPITILSIGGAITSVYLFLVEKKFFERHFIGAIKRDLEAYEQYYLMLTLYILQTLIAISVIAFLAKMLRDVFLKHAIKADIDKSEKKELERGINLRIIAFFALGVLSEASSVYHIASLPYFNRGWIFEYSNVISSAVSIAFILSAWLLIAFVKSEIRKNYKLDY
ncbi:MAG: hypothetical protein E7611_01360 [Ruminococcaceae bacterium]|nr:hypothetical protein [Oscillospiraceae bacterium]